MSKIYDHGLTDMFHPAESMDSSDADLADELKPVGCVRRAAPSLRGLARHPMEHGKSIGSGRERLSNIKNGFNLASRGHLG